MQKLKNLFQSGNMNYIAVCLRRLEQESCQRPADFDYNLMKSQYSHIDSKSKEIIQYLKGDEAYGYMRECLYFEQGDEELNPISDFTEEVNKIKNDQCAKVHYRRGKAAFLMKKYDDALNEYKLVISLKPDDKMVLKKIRKVKVMLKKQHQQMSKKLSKMFK